MASISPSDLAAALERGDAAPILDVRSESEFVSGHVPGAVNIPFNQLGNRISDVPGRAGDLLIVYCGHGPRAYIASVALRRAGRRVVYLRGHWAAWQRRQV